MRLMQVPFSMGCLVTLVPSTVRNAFAAVYKLDTTDSSPSQVVPSWSITVASTLASPPAVLRVSAWYLH